MGEFFLVNLYLGALILGIVVVSWIQHNRGTIMLMSVRNLFLGGFIYYQLISVLYWTLGPGQEKYGELWPILRPDQTLTRFCLLATLFLAAFFLAYKKFNFLSNNPGRFQFKTGVPTDGFLLLMALLLAAIGLSMRLGFFGGYFMALSIYSGTAITAASSGVAAWVLFKKIKNPVVIAWSGIIIGINLMSLLGGFSRRGLLSIGLAILWALFYRFLYKKSSWKVVFLCASCFIPSLMVMSGFTAVRESGGMAVNTAVAKLNKEAVQAGFMRIVSPSDAGPVALWLTENYPHEYRYRHMFTPYYTFAHFVPRAWWLNKPTTLSFIAVQQIKIRNVSSGLNVGPGILGQAAAEGGLYAALVYGMLAGLICRCLDDLTRININNVYVVLVIGSALGEVIGSSRGETSYMVGVGATGMFASFFLMLFIGKCQGLIWPSRYQTTQ